jgi:hypothetical protein
MVIHEILWNIACKFHSQLMRSFVRLRCVFLFSKELFKVVYVIVNKKEVCWYKVSFFVI